MITEDTLNDWFSDCDFDQVKKITGIDPMSADEADDLPENSNEPSRDDLLEDAHAVWNKMSYEEKLEYYQNY